METLPNQHSKTYNIVASDCNGQREVTLQFLANKILDVATEHADILGIGYADITSKNQAWVLARLALEMERYPKPYDTLIIETWIESINKHFSERNFSMKDAEGNIYGYARSVWFVIDLTTRKSLDISSFDFLNSCLGEQECPMAKIGKVRPVVTGEGFTYKVKAGDIDYNRHFNSGKQIEHILNLVSMYELDANYIHRFEISYMNEAHFNQELSLLRYEEAPNNFAAEMKPADGSASICRCRIILKER